MITKYILNSYVQFLGNDLHLVSFLDIPKKKETTHRFLGVLIMIFLIFNKNGGNYITTTSL